MIKLHKNVIEQLQNVSIDFLRIYKNAHDIMLNEKCKTNKRNRV